MQLPQASSYSEGEKRAPESWRLPLTLGVPEPWQIAHEQVARQRMESEWCGQHFKAL